MIATATVGTPIRVAADALLKSTPGACLGFIVNSTSSGTVTLYDGADASGSAFLSFTPTVNVLYELRAAFQNGLYFVKTNTINVTFFVA